VTCCHRCGDCSNKCNVCQSHMVGSSNISSGLDHVGHPAKNLFNSVIISLGRNFSSKHLWVHNVPDCFVECTHVKVQPRVHKSSGRHIFWIQLIIFSILSNKVSSSRLRFCYDNSSIFQCWHRVLWVHFHILLGPCASIHQINTYGVVFQTKCFTGHPEKTARS